MRVFNTDAPETSYFPSVWNNVLKKYPPIWSILVFAEITVSIGKGELTTFLQNFATLGYVAIRETHVASLWILCREIRYTRHITVVSTNRFPLKTGSSGHNKCGMY